MELNPGREASSLAGPDDAQVSFRQASAVLEAAHQRIALLRQSLLNLTESVPVPTPAPPIPAGSPSSDIRPPHDAILLSGATIDEQGNTSSLTLDTSRVRTSLPQLVEQDSLADALASATPENITLPPAPSGTTIRQLPPYRAPTLPSTSSPGRSWLDSQHSHRRDAANPDDPSTSLGRRVAARESGSEARQVLNTAYATIPQLQQILLESTATIARNLENLNNSLLQRVQNSESSSSSRPDLAPIHTTVSADGRLRRSLQVGGGRGSQSPVGVNAAQISSSSLFPIRPPPNRRIRSVIRADSGRQSTGASTISPLASSGSGQSTNAARLSMLSNFSAVDNLSTPATPSSNERPILFDEPDSYIPQLPAPVEPPPDPPRGYFIRRHVNPDGDEVVHNVFWNDSLDDPIPPAPPRQPPENSRHRWGLPELITVVRPSRMVESSPETSNWPPPPQSRPPGEVPRRRRGWARLDADGNEIPTDEEDQLERLRSENRIRAQQQSRAATASQTEMLSDTGTTSAASMIGAAGQNHAPTSRGTPGAGELDATIALVRSHRREIGMLTNALDSVVSLDRTRRLSTPPQPFGPGPLNAEPLGLEDEPELFGSAIPFFVDPLPMPLSMMVTKSQKVGVGGGRGAGGRRVVAGRVPEQTCLAGR